MKIIENNFGHIRCEICDSVFELEKDDILNDYDGEHWFQCPICGCKKYIPDDHDYITLSKYGSVPHK